MGLDSGRKSGGRDILLPGLPTILSSAEAYCQSEASTPIIEANSAGTLEKDGIFGNNEKQIKEDRVPR